MSARSRIPLEKTYWKLVERFEQSATGDLEYFPFWDDPGRVIYVSLQHSVCLHYLVWLTTKSKDAMERFTEVGIQWRRENHSIHVARTRLMKEAALLKKRLQQMQVREKQAIGGFKGTKTQVENKIGVHSEDYGIEKHQANGRKGQAKQMAEGRPPNTNHWLVIDPYGRELYVYNMNDFCRKHGLVSNHMYGVAKGNREHHRGYWCQKLEPDDYTNRTGKRRIR